MERLNASSVVDARPPQPRKFPETAGSKHPTIEYTLPDNVEANLDKHQINALGYMVRAVRRIGEVYLEQSRPETAKLQEPFYPAGISRQEVREAGKVNPAILSPYTIVTRTESGLEAVPQHLYYQAIIKKKGIVDLLQRAAKEIHKSKQKDPQLESYLKARALAFQTGNFEPSEAIWLTRDDEPIINIVIGFYDTYTDRFLGLKFAAQAWVDILEPETTRHAQWFQERLLDLQEQKTGHPSPRIKLRVAHLRAAGGQAGHKEWAGQSQPCQREWREKYGSRLTIWIEPLALKFRTRKLPAYKLFVNPINIRGTQDYVVRLANLRTHTGHETFHALLLSENIDELGDEKNWIKELNCDLNALVRYREIAGVNPRESEAAMALKLAESYVDYEDRETRKEYHEASTILLNYLIQRGSVWIENGLITWSDTQQVFNDMQALLTEIEDLIEKGKVARVREIKSQYHNPEIYKYLVTKQSFPYPNSKRKLTGD